MIALKKKKETDQNGYEYFSSFKKNGKKNSSTDKLLHLKDYYPKPPVKIWCHHHIYHSQRLGY